MSTAGVIELFRAAAGDPQETEILCSAFEIASKSLHDRDRRPNAVNEVIARRIVRLAQEGERDPALLAKRTLEELGLPPG